MTVCGGLISLVLLAAPDDAAAKLRVAWASQYEWSEDKVSNATLWFRYSYHWKGTKEGQEWRYDGRAQVVTVGSEIVRSHYPGLSDARRKQIASHVAWVLGRFGRRPFEEEFKEKVFGGPETTEDGLLRISVAPRDTPLAKTYFLLKEDRLKGREWSLGTSKEPRFIRLTYTTANLGNGYAILGEDVTRVTDGKQTSTRRRLAPAQGKEFPHPQSYSYRLTATTGMSEVQLEFVAPTVNAKHPLIGDPAARAALKEGWERRYVLPNDIRIEAPFHRRVDRDLIRLGWWDTVKGTLQVWGMDHINVALDERIFPDQRWTGEIKRLCEEHFEGLFFWLRDRPFDKQFEDCGFEFIKTTDKTVAVQVFGNETALGFLLQDGKIVGYRRNAGGEEAWWRFRLKKVRGDKMRIESMSAKLSGDAYKLACKYKRMKGIEVPRYFEVIGGPRTGRGGEGQGVAEYNMKKVKVSFRR